MEHQVVFTYPFTFDVWTIEGDQSAKMFVLPSQRRKSHAQFTRDYIPTGPGLSRRADGINESLKPMELSYAMHPAI